MEAFTLLFYTGIAAMALAALLFAAESIRFVVKKKSIGRKLDAEYGDPQKYKSRQEGNVRWPQ